MRRQLPILERRRDPATRNRAATPRHRLGRDRRPRFPPAARYSVTTCAYIGGIETWADRSRPFVGATDEGIGRTSRKHSARLRPPSPTARSTPPPRKAPRLSVGRDFRVQWSQPVEGSPRRSLAGFPWRSVEKGDRRQRYSRRACLNDRLDCGAVRSGEGLTITGRIIRRQAVGDFAKQGVVIRGSGDTIQDRVRTGRFHLPLWRLSCRATRRTVSDWAREVHWMIADRGCSPNAALCASDDGGSAAGALAETGLRASKAIPQACLATFDPRGASATEASSFCLERFVHAIHIGPRDCTT
jgi:hypothetical protein